jgi:hypothetical protein
MELSTYSKGSSGAVIISSFAYRYGSNKKKWVPLEV